MKHVIIDGNNYINIALSRTLNEIKKQDESKTDEWWEGLSKKLFLQMLRKLQRQFKASSLYYIVWDHANGSAWRKSKFSEYKENRNHFRQLKAFLPIGLAIAEELNITNLGYQDAEADDVIFAYCKHLKVEDNQADITIVSRDRDMLQVVQQGHADRVWDPVSKKDIKVPPYDIVTFKCLVGDSSDNIDGLLGVGPKRALKKMERGLTPEEEQHVESLSEIIALSKFYKHDEMMRVLNEQGIFGFLQKSF